jgi:transglutaminase-like putative cysteine protease
MSEWGEDPIFARFVRNYFASLKIICPRLQRKPDRGIAAARRLVPDMKLRIRHRTTYRYAENITLGPHRLMLRPREDHNVRIENSTLEISPAHELRWMRDMNGNCVALVDFLAPARELMIYSEIVLRHDDSNPFAFKVDTDALRYPFSYDEKTLQELGTFRQMVYPGEADFLHNWLSRFWQKGESAETVALLQGLNAHIYTNFKYRIRPEEGVQLPAETIRRGSGSCRDFATLFLEACRAWGLAARFVSGYLWSGAATDAGASTHAWAEVYLPGGGWTGFDPTAGLLTTSQYVPVAVSRHSENAMPISGSFTGTLHAFLNIEVDVRVDEINEQQP